MKTTLGIAVLTLLASPPRAARAQERLPDLPTLREFSARMADAPVPPRPRAGSVRVAPDQDLCPVAVGMSWTYSGVGHEIRRDRRGWTAAEVPLRVVHTVTRKTEVRVQGSTVAAFEIMVESGWPNGTLHMPRYAVVGPDMVRIYVESWGPGLDLLWACPRRVPTGGSITLSSENLTYEVEETLMRLRGSGERIRVARLSSPSEGTTVILVPGVGPYFFTSGRDGQSLELEYAKGPGTKEWRP